MVKHPDTFENGDLSNYGQGATSTANVDTGTVKFGSYSLEITNSGTTSSIGAVTESSTQSFVSPGDDFEFWTYFDGADSEPWFTFGYSDGSAGAMTTGERVEVSNRYNEIALAEGNTNVATTGVSISTNTWYKVKVTSNSSGDVTAYLYDGSGNQMASVSVSSWWSSTDGIAWGLRDSNNTSTGWFDCKSPVTSQGKIKLSTSGGIVDLPIYPLGSSGSNVYEILRVNTPSGGGYIPLADKSSATYSYLRIKTQNHGILAVHDSNSI